jgi:hypothetical protein
VVTYIQPHLIPHLILRGVIGLFALARRTFPRRCQPHLLVPTRRFHGVGGVRRRSVPKLRKLSVGLSANQDPMRGPAACPWLRGFGILTAKGIVDELIYSEVGNEVLMIKHTA